MLNSCCQIYCRVLLLILLALCQRRSMAQNWAETIELPPGEKSIPLFNGRDLSGWEGQIGKHFSVVEGAIRAANDAAVPASTYLFTKGHYREFRLLLEVKQTRSPRHSTMHSAIAALGQRITDGTEAYGFRGPLLLFCDDWGVWDANRRERVEPATLAGGWQWDGENVGQWNQIEILVIGDRIRMAANGRQVMDFVDDPAMLTSSPIGLQLHANDRPQEYYFRGLILSQEPVDRLITLSLAPNPKR